MQFAFDFMAPPAPPPPKIDTLAVALIEAKLVPNGFILDLNRGLTNPDELELPSRLFRFPIEFMSGNRREDGESRLLLRHPDLTDLPFVRRVAETVGEMPGWEVEDEFGRDRGAQGRWWHAVDLCREKHWQGLLRTSNFTDRASLMHAIGFGLSGTLSVKTARAMLTELQAEEPADRSEAALLGKMLSPSKCATNNNGKPIKEPYYILNIHGDPEITVWMYVHGIEDGWFESKNGHLRMSKQGIARRGGEA